VEGSTTEKEEEVMRKMSSYFFCIAALLAILFCSLDAVNPQHVFADLTEGLVAYYPFNGNANDESGNGNHGEIFGATLTSSKFGEPDSAYSFDGVDDYISAAADSLPTGDRTTSIWFYTDSSFIPRHRTLLGFGGGNCGESWFQTINEVVYGMSGHCDRNNIFHYYSQEPVGEWFHWVMTARNDSTKIYFNGEEKESSDNFFTDTVVLDRVLILGGCTDGFGPYQDGNVTYWNGKLDEVRIYDRVLSEEEILELYNFDPTGIEDFNERVSVPRGFSLSQNYPNPFNPSTTISFDIPETASVNQSTNLTIYTIRGKRVKELVNSDLVPGTHKIHWNGRNDRGESVSSGIYLYTLKAGSVIFTRKMTVLK
jgi:hypothetical protein